MLDGINRHMRAIIRLSETRAALKVYISKNELVTYEELAEVLGVSAGKGLMGEFSSGPHAIQQPDCPRPPCACNLPARRLMPRC